LAIGKWASDWQGRWNNEIFNLTGSGAFGRRARRIWK
jgi:hypothetical protein